ncbi:hypothetical protein ASG17_07815 [Brevundimonas sp. Leaf363]|nr:hypothetical protein ASG17_07815 [Brevundimonas sp. Leaf363]
MSTGLVERLEAAENGEVSERPWIATDLMSEAAARVDELATLVRMLVRHVPETKAIRAKAVDYLGRHNLNPSPLRALQTDSSGDEP